jgi:hypothetical protein
VDKEIWEKELESLTASEKYKEEELLRNNNPNSSSSSIQERERAPLFSIDVMPLQQQQQQQSDIYRRLNIY